MFMVTTHKQHFLQLLVEPRQAVTLSGTTGTNRGSLGAYYDTMDMLAYPKLQ